MTTLEKLEAECEKWMRKRMELPAGSSRAKVTTINARWSAACSVRDRYLERMEK